MACKICLLLLHKYKRILYIDDHARLGNSCYASASEVSRPPLAHLPCLCFCRHWSTRCRTSYPWGQAIRVGTNAETLWYGILPWRRAIINTGRNLLYGKYLKYDLSGVVTNRYSCEFPSYGGLENSIYSEVPIRSSMFLWCLPQEKTKRFKK